MLGYEQDFAEPIPAASPSNGWLTSTFGKESFMPKRLKTIAALLLLLALSNITSAIFGLVVAKDFVAALPRFTLGSMVGLALFICAWCVFTKKQEAKWLSVTTVALILVLGTGLGVLQFLRRFSAGFYFPWDRVLFYFTQMFCIVAFPVAVYWVFSSKKSRAWFAKGKEPNLPPEPSRSASGSP